MAPFTTITWNMGGVAYLRTPPSERPAYREKVQSELQQIIRTYSPDIILMQEVVRYEENNIQCELISPPEGYAYQSSIAINSIHQNHPLKWDSIRTSGMWPKESYLGQGNAILWKKELKHSSIWELDQSTHNSTDHIVEEKVRIDTGLFTGYRDTEPRIAVVYHFAKNDRDIFIVNVHLTTLRGEREGLPAIDLKGSRVRQNQISILLEGIVSRYNEWRKTKGDSPYKKNPLWILAGDFNATPNSVEIQTLEEMSFMDISPVKGLGTKRKKSNDHPSITVDYIFAGPTYHAFDPQELSEKMYRCEPDYRPSTSDHYPVIATIEI